MNVSPGPFQSLVPPDVQPPPRPLTLPCSYEGTEGVGRQGRRRPEPSTTWFEATPTGPTHVTRRVRSHWELLSRGVSGVLESLTVDPESVSGRDPTPRGVLGLYTDLGEDYGTDLTGGTEDGPHNWSGVESVWSGRVRNSSNIGVRNRAQTE